MKLIKTLPLRFNNLPYRKKLLITHSLVLVVPIIVLGFYSFYQSRKMLINSKLTDIDYYFSRVSAGLNEAIVVSMGTGTAVVSAKDGNGRTVSEYMGGTGVGGGTIVGLAKQILGISDIDHLINLAETGDIEKIDLRIGDITKKDLGGLPSYMTASNFGKLDDMASKNDLALGIVNMVFESIGMLAVFAARSKKTRDVVLTGNLSKMPQAVPIFEILSQMFDMNFVIPKNSEFATVIGAALAEFENEI